jgi:predicted metal-dependent hydrolase
MLEQHYTILDKTGKQIRVNLKRDKRLTKTSRWERLPDGSLYLRVPYRLPGRRIGRLLEQISDQLDKITVSHARRNDTSLQKRAELINQKYFKGSIQFNAIRWVSNMHSRLGSCTRGGRTDGEIRLNNKIRSWPDWVVDYVIAHELMHRKHPNHSADFWKDLTAIYPLTERARGFIEGAGFAAGQSLEEETGH